MITRHRRPLTPEEIAESARLKDIYNKRKSEARSRGIALTQTEIGERCEWKSPQSTVNQYMTGKLALNLDALMRLSKALDFAPEDVSPRLAQSVQHLTYPSIQAGNVEPGPPITTAPRRIEIVGTAQLGNDGYWVGLDNSDGWVETWSRDEDAYALRLKGDSMAPAIRSGWVAVCEPNHRLVPGEYVMVTTSDGQSMVKELLFESEDGVSVMSVNSAYERRTIDWSDIDKIHYVGNILAPSKILSRI
ncbi:LexA family transcriptional regulator [Pseudomonas sp. p99-361]|uniref:S24 family peptidase n=1 Tax=Pseudomonas TaxID=286 RepID=UPI0004A71410|nr:Cro/Cl family transcriptional regulator [Pseudomonas putida SJTE-1]MBI6916940.1 LexA family transcriptional regulator [Pseudomonas juntendi]PYC07908.1 Cro/Cl family transcriptional regulator [Pseudomonas sp. MB-090624]QEQ89763.1 LexA family transcriptional regulator [Pseudomonas putida]RRV20504.1 LexA family transcriptional regulator [Pseudomonas sp. p99-361]